MKNNVDNKIKSILRNDMQPAPKLSNDFYQNLKHDILSKQEKSNNAFSFIALLQSCFKPSISKIAFPCIICALLAVSIFWSKLQQSNELHNFVAQALIMDDLEDDDIDNFDF